MRLFNKELFCKHEKVQVTKLYHPYKEIKYKETNIVRSDIIHVFKMFKCEKCGKSTERDIWTYRYSSAHEYILSKEASKKIDELEEKGFTPYEDYIVC